MVYHKLSHTVRARYIRFRPTAWHGHISMRVEVYGCKGNTAFLSRKLVFHFLADFLRYAPKVCTCSHKKKQQQEKTNNPRRHALRSYKFSEHEYFLPAVKLTRAKKLRQPLVYMLAPQPILRTISLFFHFIVRSKKLGSDDPSPVAISRQNTPSRWLN